MEPGTYHIRMQIAGEWLEKKQYCCGTWDCGSCRFVVSFGFVELFINKVLFYLK